MLKFSVGPGWLKTVKSLQNINDVMINKAFLDVSEAYLERIRQNIETKVSAISKTGKLLKAVQQSTWRLENATGKFVAKYVISEKWSDIFFGGRKPPEFITNKRKQWLTIPTDAALADPEGAEDVKKKNFKGSFAKYPKEWHWGSPRSVWNKPFGMIFKKDDDYESNYKFGVTGYWILKKKINYSQHTTDIWLRARDEANPYLDKLMKKRVDELIYLQSLK